MSELAALLAQLTGSNQQPASDPALAAVKLARASIDALVLKLGQTIDAKVVGQLAAGLTQLAAGNESFVLKLETPLPTGTAVSIKVAATPQGTPAVTVSVPSAAPQAAQPMPVPTPTAPLVQAQAAQPAAPQAGTPQPLRQATQLPLSDPAGPPVANQPNPTPTPASGQPAAPSPQIAQQPASLPTTTVAQPQPQPVVPQAAATVAVAQTAPQPTPMPQPAPSPQAASAPLPQPVAAQPAQPGPTVPAPGQPALQVPLPVAPPLTSTLVTQTAPSQAQPQAAQPQTTTAPVAASPTVTSAAASTATAQPAPATTTQPAPILTTPLAAQPQQPLPTHPSPYPVQVPQAATPAAAQQLPFPATARPAIPPLNLADPAQAAARQDSAAPLMAKLAPLVTASVTSLPRPVLEMALRVLANRVDLNRGAPDARTLEAAVLRSGVLLTPLTREPAADTKSALLALRSTLLAFLGGDNAAPVATAERPAPPIKGEPPRAPAAQPSLADLPADGHETARTLLGQTDAALSRLKLLQAASQPAADARPDAPAPRNELRVEIPMMLGTETGILQLMVERDAKRKHEPERQRGWRMRFAMSFSQIGEVGADIALFGHSANIAIWAADPDTAGALDELLPELASAIQRHGLELTSLRVRRGAPQHGRTAPGRLLDSAR